MKLPGIFFALSAFTRMTASAVTLSSFDDFPAPNTLWANGVAPGIISLGGGPAGSTDSFLQVRSFAGSGVSSRLVIFNAIEWSGDYLGTGIGQIEMDLANFGATVLDIRLAFTEAFVGNGYVSVAPVSLPADAVWRHFVFPIEAPAFTRIGTTQTFTQVLGSVVQFRILSQAGGPPTSTRGDSIEGSLGIDNVRAAVPEPSAALLLVASIATGAGFGRTRRSRAGRHQGPGSI